MMNSKFIIECPSCKIRFFVKEDLLLEAGGFLRCGFCDHLFDGNEHIVYKTLDVSKDENSSKEAATTSVNLENTINPDEDVPIKAEPTETNWEEVANTLSSFSIDFKVADKGLIDSDAKDEENITPSSINTERVLAEEQPFSIDHDILEALENTDFDNLLQLDEQELPQQEINTIVDSSSVDEIATNNTVKDEQSIVFKDLDSFESEYTEVDNKSIPMDIHGNVLKKVSELDFIQPKLENKKEKRHWILWSFLCVLALGVLAAQYIRFIAPTAKAGTIEREWAIKACPYLLCTVPPIVDVNKIATSRLVVRANHEYSNVLDVDAVIINQLSTQQPFPIIELRFTDLNGQAVASRLFYPKDYLSADMFAKNLMPSNTPIYIRLSIIDPGETAVGYTLNYYDAN